VLLNFLAFLLTLTVVQTVLPSFSRLVGKSLSLKQLGEGWIWAGLLVAAGALLSGSYPAIILSSFQPASALRGLTRGVSRGTVMRKSMVIFQFSLAVLLIAATLIIRKQMVFIRSRDLGADINQILVLKIPPVDEPVQQALLARTRVAGLAPVADAAVSTSIPGRDYSNVIGGIRRQSAPQDETKSLFIIDADERYSQFFKIPLTAGRTFSEGFQSDQTSIMLNEEAVKLLGFDSAENALGQNILVFGDPYRIIGVSKNYHHKSLREKIEPVIFWPLPYSIFSGTNYLSLKIKGTSIKTTIEAIQNQWKGFFPGQPFEYSFLDDDFSRQYETDRRFGRIFGLSSMMAIFISCLGLFGLASFSAEQRTREIGIRKVFGASIAEITAMLAGEFVRWVVLANLIAWPLTWIIMSRWLEGFAYRTSVDVLTLGISALSALAVALATVSYKAVRSAAANPVDSIRYE
jgi:putative ABC transport system permease protein